MIVREPSGSGTEMESANSGQPLRRQTGLRCRVSSWRAWSSFRLQWPKALVLLAAISACSTGPNDGGTGGDGGKFAGGGALGGGGRLGGNGGSSGAGGTGAGGGIAGGSGNAAGAGNTGGNSSAGGSSNSGGSGNAAGGMGGAAASPNIGQGSAFPNGIGTGWNWTTGVVAHDAGPYAPCGMLGTGAVTFGAANPVAAEVAFASRAGVVFFYSSATGGPVRTPVYASGPLAGVDYSRDGTKLVVAGDTGVQIVRLADSTVLFNAQPFALVARAAALSPDGSSIAALGWDSQPTSITPPFILRLVRVSDGKSIAETTLDEAPDGLAPQFSPDGSLVVAGAYVLSLPSLATQLQLPGNTPPQTALSPDGTMVAEDGSVVDIATAKELKSPTLSSIQWSAFSPDGTLYAESDVEYGGVAIHLYSTSDWTEVGTASIAYPSGNDDYNDGRFFFSADGTEIVSTLTAVPYPYGENRPVFQIVSVPGLVPQAVIAGPQVGAPLVFSPDGSLVAAQFANSTTGVWRTSDLSLLSDLPQDGGGAFLANGTFEFLPIGPFYNPLTGASLGLGFAYAISPDGRLGTFQFIPDSWVFRLADLSIQATVPTPTVGLTTDHNWTFSPDNRIVAGTGTDPQGNNAFVTVFDATTGATLATLPGAAPIALTTNPGGAARLAAFVPGTTTVGVWSIPDGNSLLEIENAEAQGNTAAMAFSLDGSLIAEGIDGIRIYEVETGTLRQTLPAQTDPLLTSMDPGFHPYTGVVSLAFSASGQLASAGFDGTVRFWCSP
jgi:WD40 repeat protein